MEEKAGVYRSVAEIRDQLEQLEQWEMDLENMRTSHAVGAYKPSFTQSPLLRAIANLHPFASVHEGWAGNIEGALDASTCLLLSAVRDKTSGLQVASTWSPTACGTD